MSKGLPQTYWGPRCINHLFHLELVLTKAPQKANQLETFQPPTSTEIRIKKGQVPRLAYRIQLVAQGVLQTSSIVQVWVPGHRGKTHGV